MLLSERRQRYRRVLAGDSCVYPASVFDAMSARMAESLGYEVGMLAGSIASAAVLGAPDLVVLTLTEFAEQIRRVTRAGSLSLMVDADHGYGNALNVMRTVEELETAGVAAFDDRRHPAAGGIWRCRGGADQSPGNARQAARRGVGEAGPVTRHHRAHQRVAARRHRRGRASPASLSGHRRGRLFHRRRPRTRRSGSHSRRHLPAADAGRQPGGSVVRPAVPQRPPRTHRPARPRAVLRRRPSRVRRAQAPQGRRHPPPISQPRSPPATC